MPIEVRRSIPEVLTADHAVVWLTLDRKVEKSSVLENSVAVWQKIGPTICEAIFLAFPPSLFSLATLWPVTESDFTTSCGALALTQKSNREIAGSAWPFAIRPAGYAISDLSWLAPELDEKQAMKIFSWWHAGAHNLTADGGRLGDINAMVGINVYNTGNRPDIVVLVRHDVVKEWCSMLDSSLQRGGYEQIVMPLDDLRRHVAKAILTEVRFPGDPDPNLL